jgi:hypothetical protein
MRKLRVIDIGPETGFHRFQISPVPIACDLDAIG